MDNVTSSWAGNCAILVTASYVTYYLSLAPWYFTLIWISILRYLLEYLLLATNADHQMT